MAHALWAPARGCRAITHLRSDSHPSHPLAPCLEVTQHEPRPSRGAADRRSGCWRCAAPPQHPVGASIGATAR
eukprot:3759183-Prymnesium_polylepis.1